MNIIPMCNFTPLADLSFEKAPIRVALAGATGYAIGVIASSSPLACARVGVIATIAQETLFFLYSVIAKDYKNRSAYAYFNAVISLITSGLVVHNQLMSRIDAFITLYSFGIWNIAYCFREGNGSHNTLREL